MKHKDQPEENTQKQDDSPQKQEANTQKPSQPIEIGGRKGPEPTRYGDWEKKGKCVDF